MDEENDEGRPLEFWNTFNRVKDIDTEVARLQNNREVLYEHLKSQIMAGTATSHDELTDFMIAHFGNFSRNAGQEYRDLKAQVDANIGELALAVIEEGSYTDWYLGVISDEAYFAVEAGDFVVPTNGKTVVAFRGRKKWDFLSSGVDLEINTLRLRGLGKDVKDMESGDDERQIGLQVIVGDEKVADYFRTKAFQGRKDLDYIHALTLLDHPVPEDFAQEKAEQVLRQNREEVFHSIQRLNNVYDRNPKADGLMREAFAKAGELNMFEGDFALFDWDGGGSATTHVPKYLTEIAEKRGMPIPVTAPKD